MRNNGNLMNKFLYLIAITIILILVTVLSANAATTVVAVIDTGYDFDSTWNEHLKKVDSDGYLLRKPKICKSGSQDFTGSGIKDTNGHGTHVAGIIAKFAEDADYCLVILKFFSNNFSDNATPSAKAIKKAIELKVDIINYSAGGLSKMKEECDLIKKALDSGIQVVVAAGNESSNINKNPYYPAMCDDRVVAVSNVDDYGNLGPSSNYTDRKKGSRELAEEKGVEVWSLLPGNKIGAMTGTSQAAPTRVGKMIKKMKKK